MDNSTPPDAASRQKSCNACVKSKRRCDKVQPICSRCAERHEVCVYNAKRRRLDTEPDGRLAPELLGGPSQSDSAAASGLFPFEGLSGFDVDFFGTGRIAGGGGNDIDVGVVNSDEDNSIDPFVDFVDAMEGAEGDTSLWMTHGLDGGEVERAAGRGTPSYEGIREGYEMVGADGLCVGYVFRCVLSVLFLILLSIKTTVPVGFHDYAT